MKNPETNTLTNNGSVTYTKIKLNDEGDPVKLVARYHPDVFSDRITVLVDVYKKENKNWVLCKDQAEGDQTFKGVDHYVKYQRPEKYRVAGKGLGNILKTAQEMEKIIVHSDHEFKHLKDDLYTVDNIVFHYVKN